MKSERENINYGTLVMRAFDIGGNDINAFYDSSDNLVFVLDNTVSEQKTNVLLVINPDGDKKWDEILSTDYGVDLETIRPKVDNKYQKLDIEYSGLPVYENLINAYNADEDLDEHFTQLAILRDSAVRHSAMMRLNAANETISKTNATIVRTKDSIVDLQARIKTLRSKLSAAKKEIGRVNTKQSAAKILKLESQIEAANEKLKRAQKRLESAQKRLEAATADAEMASNLLNQPTAEIKQTVKSKPVMAAPEYPVQTVDADEEVEEDNDEDAEEDEKDAAEEVEETDVKPLFNEDPQILNEDIAFKPIEFNAPVFNEPEENNAPVFNEPEENIAPVVPEPEETVVPVVPEPKPVLESMTPIAEPAPVFTPRPIVEEETEIVEEKPVLETMKPVEPIVQEPEPVVEPVRPVSPIVNNFETPKETKEHSKPGFIYYILLLVLILLSVFTLSLYQKRIAPDTAPVLAAKVPEAVVAEQQPVVEEEPQPVAAEPEKSVFLDEEPAAVPEETVAQSTEQFEEPEEQDEEPIAEPEPEVEEAPVVMGVVPKMLSGLVDVDEEEEPAVSEEDVLATKPVYEPGAKHDDMFVSEEDSESEIINPDAAYFYDEEEAAYQEETNY
jgi:hypothetical protein